MLNSIGLENKGIESLPASTSCPRWPQADTVVVTNIGGESGRGVRRSIAAPARARFRADRMPSR